MKKWPINFGLFLLLFSFKISAQVICLEVVGSVNLNLTKMPINQEALIGKSIEISNFSIYFEDELISSNNVQHSFFSGRNALIDRYKGIYSFSNFSDSIYGDISIYHFPDSLSFQKIRKFELIEIKDHGIQKYFLSLNDHLFMMQKCQAYEPCFAQGLKAKEYNLDSISFVIKQPRFISEIVPAQFERKHEHVMYNAGGNSFTIEPARFVTVVKDLPGDEINTCPEYTAEYKTVTEQVLFKEGYIELEAVHPHLQTITKMELLKEGYNKLIDFVPHQYISYDSCIVSSGLGESRSNTIHLTNNCTDQVFLPCINYASHNFLNKEIFNTEQIQSCPKGYETFPSGCYKIDSIKPTFKAGQHRSVGAPSTVSTTINPEYTTRSYQKIMNAEKIPSSCIKTEIMKWSYQKLYSASKALPTIGCGNYTKRYFDEKVTSFKIIEELKKNQKY